MKPLQFIDELQQNFKEIEGVGFVVDDELRNLRITSDIDAEDLEGLVMRLYFLTTDPEKKIKFFINQYAEKRFLYLIHVSDTVWFFVMCADNNFAKLHFFIKYLLTELQPDFTEEDRPAHSEKVGINVSDKLLSARRIQSMLLPNMEKLLGKFSDSYFWFQPKDAVGGDFYWAKKTKTDLWMVIGDCTGHSVEGALASVSVMSIMNQVHKPEMQPHLLIKEVHRGLTDMQNQDRTEGYGIGCEMMVLKLDLKTNVLKYAGTGLQLYQINDKVRVFKTKKSTFDPDRVIKYIRSRSLQLTPNDGIFTHSDGLQDQMNVKGKRLKNQSLVKSIRENGVTESGIRELFEQWQGKEEQTDDIVCLYFKL